jgi:hypothetical protein
MITVVRKHEPDAQYIGRGSPLGNPFRMNDERDRDRVCDQYQVWFNDKVAANDPVVMNELRRLYRLAAKGDLKLGCFCAPRRCHGDTIKRFLLSHA